MGRPARHRIRRERKGGEATTVKVVERSGAGRRTNREFPEITPWGYVAEYRTTRRSSIDLRRVRGEEISRRLYPDDVVITDVDVCPAHVCRPELVCHVAFGAAVIGAQGNNSYPFCNYQISGVYF